MTMVQPTNKKDIAEWFGNWLGISPLPRLFDDPCHKILFLVGGSGGIAVVNRREDIK